MPSFLIITYYEPLPRLLKSVKLFLDYFLPVFVLSLKRHVIYFFT